MRLREHLALGLLTFAGLLLLADPPTWLLWSPLALWVALLVAAAVRLPPLSAPALGFAGVAALALARAPWEWVGFALALTVGAVTLGVAARAQLRAGTAVLLASVPAAAWVGGWFLGPGHLALERTLRADLVAELLKWMPFDARTGLSREAFQALLARAADTVVLLLPAFSLVQVVPLMAWGYLLAQAWLVGSRRPLAALPPFSRLRLPDGAVWVLCLGIFLLVTRHSAVHRAGANLSAFMAAAYFCQGLSVITFMALAMRVSWQVATSLVAVAVLLLSPLFSLFTCVLGLSDVWLDFRHLQARPQKPNP
ncbi:MAG TPA: DUF2232 domain-containing protein [Candidatus Saccharimonadales bacterium]|nr:DUF2232 domain-containing protein [Candidatus Saccharimonadales bacterium]